MQMMRQGTRANGFIVKPFEGAELFERIVKLLRSSKRIQRVILLIEDPALQDPIVCALRGEGYFVQIVEEEVAVAAIGRDSRISLIILDSASSQRGIDMCRLLRASDETLNVPILMFATSELELRNCLKKAKQRSGVLPSNGS
jgi:DNA-binding response OmpR family regulator